MLALLVARYEPLPVIMAVAAMGVMVALCLWPDGATPLAVFVLYANLPAVFEDSVPQIASVGLLGLLLALPLVHHVVIRRGGLWVDRPLRLMLLFLGVLLVSAVGAVSAAVAADRIVLFIGEGVIVYALMLNVVRTGRTLRRVMATIVFTSAFLACLTVYQSVSGNYHQQFGGLAGRMLEDELVAEKEGNLKRDPGEVRMRAADRDAARSTAPTALHRSSHGSADGSLWLVASVGHGASCLWSRDGAGGHRSRSQCTRGARSWRSR